MASRNTKKTLYALAALAAPAIANIDMTQQGVGFCTVTNACDYDVYISNVPSSGGGFDAIPYTLKAKGGNDPYKFQYTQLSNGNGWSIKLSKSEGQFGSNIMQYETTFHDDGTIWYDLSDVDGNPWDKNWMIEASGDSACKPKQQAYRYSTDDAYGMQSCDQKASTHVTLCSAQNGTDSSGGESASSAPPPASSPPPVPTGHPHSFSWPAHNPHSFSAAGQPSTLLKEIAATPAAPPSGGYVTTVTQGTTVIVTETARAKKRSENEEHQLAHEHIKRHQEAHHAHHGHF